MQTVTTVEQLLDIQNCTNLIVQYSHDLDLGRPDKIWELFAVDGVWEMPANGLRFSGADEIRAGIAEHLTDDSWAARHVCTNTAIELTALDTAEALTYFINYRHYFDHPVDPAADLNREIATLGPARHVGEYIDRFVRTNGGWRIAHRRVRLGFSFRA